MAFIEQDFTVTIENTNVNGLCTNKAILQMLENIACYHSDSVGLGVNDIERTRLTWFIIAWKLKVINRPRYGEKLRVTTWARDTGRMFTHRDFEVKNADGNIVAIASSKWALINIDKGLTRIEKEIIDLYAHESKHVFDEEELKRLKEIPEYLTVKEMTVSRRDIDINKHMHNLNYLEFAYEVIPEDVALCEYVDTSKIPVQQILQEGIDYMRKELE